MPKRKRTFSAQTSNCDAGTSNTAKKCKPHQAYRAQQRHLLTRYAPAGGQRELDAKYKQSHMLGSGGFGSVYRGVRKSDSLPVAIKHILKAKVDYIPLAIKGQVNNIPKEVFLMVKAAGGPERLGESAAVTLLEWFDLDQEIVLVMERPRQCMDLLDYSILHEPLPEDTVKDIMRQLVLALIDLHEKRIFHRDIKTNNVLIQEVPGGVRVRIIDFGCSCTISAVPYNGYSGTLSYAPPELFMESRYKDGPTSVWQLGAIAYELIKNETDEYFSTDEWVRGELTLTSQVSKECMDFVNACLETDPLKRITLAEMSQHPWFRR